MKVTLQEWDRMHFDPPHSIRTLREWAKSGRILPEPELIGREYRVRPDAVYVAKRLPLESITVIKSEDPIVNEIIRGQTQKRRPA